jgi:hypothetical protein
VTPVEHDSVVAQAVEIFEGADAFGRAASLAGLGIGHLASSYSARAERLLNEMTALWVGRYASTGPMLTNLNTVHLMTLTRLEKSIRQVGCRLRGRRL